MLLWWLNGKESACQCRTHRFSLWVRKIPWRRKWQLTPVSLPGKSHGQKSLEGYSPWGHKRVGHNLATKQHTQKATRRLSVMKATLNSCVGLSSQGSWLWNKFFSHWDFNVCSESQTWLFVWIDIKHLKMIAKARRGSYSLLNKHGAI